MGIAGSLMVFSIAWWLAFFAMLPIGVRSQVEDGDVFPGSEPGAPSAPQLARKAFYATIAAFIIWGVLYSIVTFHLISVDDIPLPSGLKWT